MGKEELWAPRGSRRRGAGLQAVSPPGHPCPLPQGALHGPGGQRRCPSPSTQQEGSRDRDCQDITKCWTSEIQGSGENLGSRLAPRRHLPTVGALRPAIRHFRALTCLMAAGCAGFQKAHGASAGTIRLPSPWGS